LGDKSNVVGFAHLHPQIMFAADVNGLSPVADVQVVGLGVNVETGVRQTSAGVGKIILKFKQGFVPCLQTLPH
jgi:hypothetical protein